MDDIFEVLIYLLFIGASVIGGIYKNYAKKKEEERKRQRIQEAASQGNVADHDIEVKSAPSAPRTIEDFLREQFELEMEPEKPQKEIVVESEPEIKSEASEKEGVAAFENTTDTLLSDNLNDKDFSISNEIDKHEKQSKILLEEIDDSSSTIFSEDEEFDARKAVIYSEIMKRPHQ